MEIKGVRIGWNEILIIVFFLLAVYFILTRIFGHSADNLTITATLFMILANLSLFFVSSLYKLNREVGEMRLNMVNSFKKVADDMIELKRDIGEIKRKI